MNQIPEVTTDSEAQVVSDVIYSKKLLEFIVKHGIETQQYDVRPWGGYSLAYRIPRPNKAFMGGGTYGASITTHQAAVDTIHQFIKSHEAAAVDYLGLEAVYEFKQLLKEEGL